MAYRIVMVGFGTVGQGFASILRDYGDSYRKEYGLDCRVVAITDILKGTVISGKGLDLAEALDAVAAKKSLHDLPGGEKGWDALTTIRHAEGDILVEATPTNLETGEPGVTHCREGIQRGMHVVTPNKGPVALHAAELSEKAKNKGVAFRFEGTVLSGTPALNFFQGPLAGSVVREVRGIMNGTTNYILTEMESGKSYAEALKKAQELGYAETNPEGDVEGWDAAAKVVILSNMLFGADLKPSDIRRKGITGIRPEDVAEARKEGKRWKLIGRTTLEPGGAVAASVKPEKLSADDVLSHVNGVRNALCFKTDLLGEVMISGPGAGKLETGFAILNDILAIHRDARRG
jgi:homoserine dehydrogenase